MKVQVGDYVTRISHKHDMVFKVMDIVEVSPVLDTNNITSWLALKTVYEILGLISEKK